MRRRLLARLLPRLTRAMGTSFLLGERLALWAKTPRKAAPMDRLHPSAALGFAGLARRRAAGLARRRAAGLARRRAARRGSGGQKRLDDALERGRHRRGLAQVAFPLLRLLGQDVAVLGMMPQHFA